MRDLIKALRWLETYGAGPEKIREQVENVYSQQGAHRRAWKRHHRKDSIPGLLDRLPALNADLTPVRPPHVDTIHELWRYQQLINQHIERLSDHRNTDPYGPQGWAWKEAVASIAKRHEPPKPEEPMVLAIRWDWPNPDVSQSPNPLGVGDLEDDWDED